MKSMNRFFALFMGVLLLQSCALYAAYGIYRTVKDINGTLTMVSSSITRIQGVIKEGKDLKRAAEDGKLIATLSEKIPSMIQKQVEQATKDKIQLFSGDLKTASLDLAKNAIKEDLTATTQSYNNMVNVYNQFSGLMNSLEESK